MSPSATVPLHPEGVGALLARYAIRMPEHAVARTSSEAATAAVQIGFPVALKIIAAGVSHKTPKRG